MHLPHLCTSLHLCTSSAFIHTHPERPQGQVRLAPRHHPHHAVPGVGGGVERTPLGVGGTALGRGDYLRITNSHEMMCAAYYFVCEIKRGRQAPEDLKYSRQKVRSKQIDTKSPPSTPPSMTPLPCLVPRTTASRSRRPPGGDGDARPRPWSRFVTVVSLAKLSLDHFKGKPTGARYGL